MKTVVNCFVICRDGQESYGTETAHPLCEYLGTSLDEGRTAVRPDLGLLAERFLRERVSVPVLRLSLIHLVYVTIAIPKSLHT